MGGDGHRQALVPPKPPQTGSYPVLTADIAEVASGLPAVAAAAALAAGGGVLTFPLTWDTGTSSADPGAGRIRANSANMSMASLVMLSATDSSGLSIAAALGQLTASSSATKALIRVGHRTDATKYAIWSVTTSANNGAWRSFTVTPILTTSASPFNNGDPVALSAVCVGDKGDTGNPGTAASDTVAGIVRIATMTEFAGRTATQQAVTPAHLAQGAGIGGVDLISAASLSLPAVGDYFRVTGTTSIAALSARGVGRRVLLRFMSPLQLTHNSTSFALLGASNIAVTTNDLAAFASDDGTNWRMIWYSRASGQPLAMPGSLLIGTPTVVGSAVGQIDFTGIDSTFDDYELVGHGIKFLNNGSSLAFDYRVGASTWGGPQNGMAIQLTNSAGITSGAWSGAIVSSQSNAAGSISGFVLRLLGANSAESKIVRSWSVANTTGDHGMRDCGAWLGTNSAVTGIRLLGSSSILAGTFKLYGFRRA
ncbi:hypothetical protein C0V82_23320 (plasmid) [Niveispirillum cyanobacteriorum]|uniref:Uncharacterized protein n=2 Tax=Niveispirillum cyanobacteriorum TaxID=1612173 RepID=A0A2K9NLP2_9PROT|nr:hypothetical protein C0V82_23320 [Niveispirillum cyanobacteriorum]